MMRPHAIRITAAVLIVIVGLVCILGYNFVFDKNIRPVESTLIPITEG